MHIQEDHLVRSAKSEMSVGVDTSDGMPCDLCEQMVRCVVLSTDTSRGEYGCVSMCEDCVLELLADFKRRRMAAPSRAGE